MKKRIISVLLCAAMVGTLAAGCGSKEAGSDEKICPQRGGFCPDL